MLCLPGADKKSDPILDSLGLASLRWYQYFMTPPCLAINADRTIGSLRYVSMLSAGRTATGTSSSRYHECDCITVSNRHATTKPNNTHPSLSNWWCRGYR